MSINAAASQRSTIMAGRAQTCAINCRVSLRLFFSLVHACHKTGISVVGAALWRADLSEQDRSSWNASQASTAMITPRAVEQRRRDVNGQLRPNDSEFEWVRRGDQSIESTKHHPLGVALDPAIAV